MRRTFLGLAAVLCLGVALVPRLTYAQSLPVPAPLQGGGANFKLAPGIKVSDSLVMHAGAGLETRYDSNVFYTSSEEGRAQAAILRVLPALALATPTLLRDGEPVVRPLTLNFGVNLDYREYLSDQQAVRDQRDVAIDSVFRLLYSRPHFRFGVFNQFVRTADPPNVSAPQSPQFDRDYNRGGVDFTFLPGGGALELKLTYAGAVNYYEDEPLTTAGSFQLHQFNLNVKWKRWPKTAFFLEVDQQILRYLDIDKQALPFRVSLGLIGLLTPKLSTLLKIGYGNSFYGGAAAFAPPGTTDGVANYSSVIASAELRYWLARTATIAVGYEHNFQDTIFANFFEHDRAYASYDQFFLGRLLGHVRINYDRLNFQGQPAGTIPEERVEHRIALELHLDYQVKPWLYLGAGYDLWINAAPVISVAVDPMLPAVAINPDYVKHTAYARINFYY